MLNLFPHYVTIIFYFCAVAFLSGYIHLVNIVTQMYNDGAPKHKYEYIIVGAGTAGSTISASIPSDDVLLLEAGGLTTNLLDVPILTPILQKSAYDWSFETTPQTNACLGLKQKASRWPIGKGLGGSQILNYMIWSRGHHEDYRGWFTSADSYNYERDVLPHFREAESELKLTELKHKTKLAEAFVHASQQYGYEDGFMYPTVQQHQGRRWTITHNNYYSPRTGHHIVLNAYVLNLMFDRTSRNRVIGISYEKNGFVFEVLATKAVILSAGTIGTPIILLASGIGPKSEIINSTVQIRKDLPVGMNLQDHVTTGIDLILLNQTLGMRPWDVFTFESVYQYLYKGEGALTMNGCEALGFLNTLNATAIPNLGFMVLPIGATGDGGIHFRQILNLNDEVWADYFEPLIGAEQTSISILPIVLHPKSRGQVSLKDDVILINPNYLSHEDDIDLLVKGIRILEQLIEMPSLKRLGAEINPKPFPGCGEYQFQSTSYWQCYVRHLTLSAFHPVGTCRMGDSEDPTTVVNRDFQVLGIENLYVVDASVMPTMPSANTNAAVAMLAKKFLSTIGSHNHKQSSNYEI